MNLHEENGQALVLALAFFIFASLVIGATLTFAYASELSMERLDNQRDTVYAADGATDAAIQLGLVDATVGRYGDGRCQATDPPSANMPYLLTTTSNDTDVSVICTWSSDPLKVDRVVTYSAFVADLTTPVVRATVTYHFHLSTPTTVEVTSWTYCTHGPPC